MKARWYFVLAVVSFILGVAIPYAMYMKDVSTTEGWGGVLWIVVAPIIYSYIAIPFWIIGFIFLVIGIWRWKNE